MPSVSVKVGVAASSGGYWTPQNQPSGLTLTLIPGGVQIDWTDNTGGIATTEIWGQSDGASYALLYTINAGIVTKSESVAPVDLRYYKIRQLKGSSYSPFTTPLGIETGQDLMLDKSVWSAVGLAYWDTKNNWSGDGIKVICNGGNGYADGLNRWGFFEVGKSYRINFSVVVNSGYLMFLGSPIHYDVSGDYSVDFTCAGLDVNYFVGWNNFVGSITNYIVRELILSSRKFNNGKLVLTFDDLTQNQYDVAFPLLNTQGVKATFYANASTVGNVGAMTWAEAYNLYIAGMDVQDHFNTHTDLTTLTEGQIITGLGDANAAFIANGLPAPIHIAYPFGVNNPTVISAMDGLRVSGRIVGGSSNVWKQYPIYRDNNKFTLQVKPVDNIDDAGVIVVKNLMDNVKLGGTALITLAHGIDAGPDNITSARLISIINYAKSIGLDIITISQLYPLMIQ